MAKAKGGQNTVQQVEALVRPVIEGMGLILWDVRFEKEGPDWYLRVLIDPAGEGPLDMNTCEAASRAIDPVIEEADPSTRPTSWRSVPPAWAAVSPGPNILPVTRARRSPPVSSGRTRTATGRSRACCRALTARP